MKTRVFFQLIGGLLAVVCLVVALPAASRYMALADDPLASDAIGAPPHGTRTAEEVDAPAGTPAQSSGAASEPSPDSPLSLPQQDLPDVENNIGSTPEIETPDIMDATDADPCQQATSPEEEDLLVEDIEDALEEVDGEELPDMPPSAILEVGERQTIYVQAGQAFTAALSVTALQDGQIYYSNFDRTTEEVISYSGQTASTLYDPAIGGVIFTARLLPCGVGDIPFDLSTAHMESDIIKDGQNFGFGVLHNAKAPADMRAGSYLLPLTIEWQAEAEGEPYRINTFARVVVTTKEASDTDPGGVILTLGDVPPLTVAPGEELRLDIPVVVEADGQTYASNISSDTGDALPYQDGAAPLVYDQTIVQLLSTATIAIPQLPGTDIFDAGQADLQGNIVDGGLNHGYGTVENIHVLPDAPEEVYRLPVRVEWETTAPDAAPQALDTTVEVLVRRASALTPWGDGGVIVYSYDELREAAADPQYSTIYLGYDSTNNGMFINNSTNANGVQINRSLTIDGADPLTEGAMAVLSNGAGTGKGTNLQITSSNVSLTFRNMTIANGSNKNGIVNADNQMFTSLLFENVTYSGTQLAVLGADYGSVGFADCNLTFSALRAADAALVHFAGNTQITHNGSSQDGIVQITGSGVQSVVIAQGATVDVTSRVSAFLYINRIYPSLIVQGNLNLTVNGSTGSLSNRDNYLASMDIVAGGSCTIIQSSNDTPSVLAVSLTVSGDLSIIRPSGTIRSLIRMEPGGLFTLNESGRLFLDDRSKGVINCRTSAGAKMVWHTRVINQHNGSTGRTEVWNNEDMSVFTVEADLVLSGGTVTNVTNLHNNDMGAMPNGTSIYTASKTGLELKDADLLRVGGTPTLWLDRIDAGATSVRGQAKAGVAVTLWEYLYSPGHGLGPMNQAGTADVDGNGRFTLSSGTPFQPVTLGNRVYAMGESGGLQYYTYRFVEGASLRFEEIPDALPLKGVPLSGKTQLLLRMDRDWHIVIYDPAPAGNGYQLYAKVLTPLTSSPSGDILDNGLIFLQGSTVQWLTDSDLLVASRDPASSDSTQIVQWAQNQGVLGWLDGFRGVADEQYTGVIRWTLVDGP